MIELAAAAFAIAAAAFAAYRFCRDLHCAPWPARFAAAVFGLSGAVLVPGIAASAVPGVVPPLLLPFAWTGLFSRERRKWSVLALAAACLALRLRPSAAAVLPGELAEALVLALLAGLGAQRLWDGEGGAAFTIGAAAALAFAVAEGKTDASTLLVEALPAAAALAVVAATSRERRARAGLAVLAALFATQRSLEIAIRGDVGAAPVASAASSPHHTR
jgi:hypothetical protein